MVRSIGRWSILRHPMAPGHHDPAGETWAVGSCYQAGAQGLDHFGIFGLEIIGRSSHFRGIRYVCISKGFLGTTQSYGKLIGDATRSTRFHKSLHTLPQSSCNVFPDAPGHINIRYMHHLHGMPIVPEEHYLPAAHNSKCINLSLCHRLTQ